MTTEHYFVVRYTEGEGWSWDTDTESANFPDGTIYYPDLNKWEKSGSIYNSDELTYERDETASQQLGQAIRVMNGTN